MAYSSSELRFHSCLVSLNGQVLWTRPGRVSPSDVYSREAYVQNWETVNWLSCREGFSDWTFSRRLDIGSAIRLPHRGCDDDE